MVPDTFIDYKLRIKVLDLLLINLKNMIIIAVVSRIVKNIPSLLRKNL